MVGSENDFHRDDIVSLFTTNVNPLSQAIILGRREEKHGEKGAIVLHGFLRSVCVSFF